MAVAAAAQMAPEEAAQLMGMVPAPLQGRHRWVGCPVGLPGRRVTKLLHSRLQQLTPQPVLWLWLADLFVAQPGQVTKQVIGSYMICCYGGVAHSWHGSAQLQLIVKGPLQIPQQCPQCPQAPQQLSHP